jgi:hypothetical protein
MSRNTPWGFKCFWNHRNRCSVGQNRGSQRLADLVVVLGSRNASAAAASEGFPQEGNVRVGRCWEHLDWIDTFPGQGEDYTNRKVCLSAMSMAGGPIPVSSFSKGMVLLASAGGVPSLSEMIKKC